jgi:hypothetical protein
MNRLDAASSPTSPADAIGVAVRYAELIPIGPGQMTAGNQVDQRVVLVPEKLQETGRNRGRSGTDVVRDASTLVVRRVAHR